MIFWQNVMKWAAGYSIMKGIGQPGRDFSPPAELDDLTEILETGVERIKKNNGRPCTYPCTKEGLQKLAEACAGYIEHLNSVNSVKDEKQQKTTARL